MSGSPKAGDKKVAFAGIWEFEVTLLRQSYKVPRITNAPKQSLFRFLFSVLAERLQEISGRRTFLDYGF